MATLCHMLADGTVATRKTARQYSHVIVGNLTQATSIQGHVRGPGLVVVGWVGRPELVAAALAERQRGGLRDRGTFTAEAINGGVRA